MMPDDEIARLQAERDALARFKTWVHAYLDAKGVRHHPPGPHSAEGGRIGDRMDAVFAVVDAARQLVARRILNAPEAIPLVWALDRLLEVRR